MTVRTHGYFYASSSILDDDQVYLLLGHTCTTLYRRSLTSRGHLTSMYPLQFLRHPVRRQRTRRISHTVELQLRSLIVTNGSACERNWSPVPTAFIVATARRSAPSVPQTLQQYQTTATTCSAATSPSRTPRTFRQTVFSTAGVYRSVASCYSPPGAPLWHKGALAARAPP